MTKCSFSQRLNDALIMKGKTAADISHDTGISEAMISQYRSGKCEPKQKRLEQFAIALGVSEAWLMGFNVPMERTSDMTTGERIKYLREKNGMTQEELGNKLGLHKSAIMKYEKGVVENIKRNTLEKMAEIFDVTPLYLLCMDDNEKKKFNTGNLSIPKFKHVPLVGSIACGTPILASENVEREVGCPDDIDVDFCLRCKGDSMIGARILDGDIVFVKAQSDVSDGEIAVVVIPVSDGEAEATLKRVYHNEDGSITCMAENPAYRPLILKDAIIEGKAVTFMSNVR